MAVQSMSGTGDLGEGTGVVPDAPLLEVEDLYVEFHTRDGVAKVLNGVSYHVDAGETLAVLGESGSGKSVTAQTIMGILDVPPAVVAYRRWCGNLQISLRRKAARSRPGSVTVRAGTIPTPTSCS